MKQYIILCILSFILFSCGQDNTNQEQEIIADAHPISHAKGFAIDHTDTYTRARVFNPWKSNEVMGTYYLIKDSLTPTPSDGVRYMIPLQSMAISSCTHIEFLSLLHELSTIKGVCNPELIFNETIQQSIKDKGIVNLGDAYSTNLERLLYLNPDAMMLSSYNGKDNNANRIESAGVSVIYNNEWTEKSLLARSEWIKFVAAFYDKLPLADSIFHVIEQAYNEACLLTQTTELSPSVLAGGNFKGTWYMPSGVSYMGELFNDAQVSYFYSSDTTDGSLPLNFETVLHHFANADIWLNAPAASMKELAELDSRHMLFKAAQEGRVYGFYKRVNSLGANDFWESAVAHPDLVLKDVIWAVHPTLLPDYEPVYMIHLQ